MELKTIEAHIQLNLSVYDAQAIIHIIQAYKKCVKGELVEPKGEFVCNELYKKLSETLTSISTEKEVEAGMW